MWISTEKKRKKSISSCFNIFKCLFWHSQGKDKGKEKLFQSQLVHVDFNYREIFLVFLFSFSSSRGISRICIFCCDITFSPPNKRHFDLCPHVHSRSVIIINIEIEFMHCVARNYCLEICMRIVGSLIIFFGYPWWSSCIAVRVGLAKIKLDLGGKFS